MKNKSITFVASSTKAFLRFFAVVVFFIATITAINAANYRLSIFNGCHAAKPVIVFVEMKKDSLSSFKYFNFSFMTKTMKDYGTANNSTCTVTPDCESVTPTLSKTITLSEGTWAYLKCLQQLDTLFACVHEALELNYGWQSADRIMMDEYAVKSGAIRDMINGCMCASIGENINSTSEITEI